MAVFIPEWVRVPGRHLPVKRIFNLLDDAHVVRRPLRPERCAADFFVQHEQKGWLALAVDHTAFATLGTVPLFGTDPRAAFEQRLSDLRRLGAHEQAPPIECLLLMWACSTDEVRALNKQHVTRFGIRMVSREQFMALGVKLIQGMLAPLSEGQQVALMAGCFPEAEVPAACTTRRYFHRDNRATLGRYFLDADQEWAIKLDLELPAEAAPIVRDFSVRLINGVAGSGKTLIALQRARLLAELFPNQRLLVLIHNTPIVADIHQRWQRAYGALPPNLEISTFFAWATRQWRLVFGAQPRMPEPPWAVPELIERQRAQWPELKLGSTQLQGEIDFINEALIVDEPAYQQASRAGRGFALRPKERQMVWALRDAVTSSLRASTLRLWSALPRELCLASPQQQVRVERYDHILVDEGQFFAPSWFQLVKLAMKQDGQLFVCADPNQGFMRNRLSWKSVGLDVAGRTKKLRRSYRSTRAILQAAGRIIEALGADDGEDYLVPDYTSMEPGQPPLLVLADTPQDAQDRLVNELAASIGDAGVPLGAVLVIYGEKVRKQDLYAALCHKFGTPRVWWFNEKTQKRAPPPGEGKDHLRMAYLDTATGLEASIVFLIGVENLFDAEEDDARREDKARKLYMAMTRAGQRLLLLSSRRLPQSMEALFERAT
jgi:hypothetical protein